MDEINKLWPEWHEDCIVGAGSFGTVYRAKSVQNGTMHYCAVKMVSVPKSPDEIKNARGQGLRDNEIYGYFRSLVDNLLNEITMMENLKNCENIVGIEDYRVIERSGEIGWDIYIRMELLTSFDKFIANPNLTLLDILKLGIDISGALIECERKNIVHRDIKPDNIFISANGIFKLGDFGIARKMEATTANMSRKGTLNYMAPEIYKSEEYGSTVDIYSLGLVLYTLLNNNRIALLPPYPMPITYEDNEKALTARFSGVTMPPPCNTDNITAQVILKACEYLPQNRYQTAAEFRNDLIYAYNNVMQSNLNRPISVNYQVEAVENGEYEEEYCEEIDVSKGKIQRILSVGLSAVTIIFSLIIMLKAPEFPVLTGLMLLMLPVSVLLSRENNISAGICAVASFIPTAVYSIKELAGLVQSGSDLNFVPVVACISALLVIFAGIAAFRKKDVKIFGNMCIYAAIAYAVRIVLDTVLQKNDFSPVCIIYILVMLCGVLFGYGYNRGISSEGIKKYLYFAAFVPAVICLIIAVVSLKTLFV